MNTATLQQDMECYMPASFKRSVMAWLGNILAKVASFLLALLLMFCLFIPLLSQAATNDSSEQIPRTNPNALWIAESEGVLKVTTAQGTVLFEIEDLDDVRAVTVDETSGRLWALSKTTLLSYNFSGVLVSQTDINNLSDELDEGDAILQVSAASNSVWLSIEDNLLRFNLQGEIQQLTRTEEDIRSIVADETQSRLWVATSEQVAAFQSGPLGTALSPFYTLDLSDIDLESSNDDTDDDQKESEDEKDEDEEKNNDEDDKESDDDENDITIRALDVDQNSGDLWVGFSDRLRRYSIDSNNPVTPLATLAYEIPIDDLQHIATADDNHIWVATDKQLLRIFLDGPAVVDVEAFNRDDIDALVADPANGDAWVARKRLIRQFDRDGRALQQIQIESEIVDLALFADIEGPEIEITLPEDNAELNPDTLNITLEISDEGAGINTDSLQLLVNSAPVEFTCQFTSAEQQDGDDDDELIANCLLANNLPSGSVTLGASIEDNRGNIGVSDDVTVTVLGDALAITIDVPQDGLLTNQPLQTISGSLNRSAELTLNGQAIVLQADNSFVFGPITLQEGQNVLTFNATDSNDNTAQRAITVTLDSIFPQIILASPTDGLQTNDPLLNFIGSVTEPAALSLSVVGSAQAPLEFTLTADNSFNVGPITLIPGRNTFLLVATDAAGNSSGVTVNVTLNNQAPVITLISPIDGLITNQVEQFFVGQLDVDATLTINSQPVILDANNAFNFGPVTLQEGSNLFTLVAEDSFSNISDLAVTLTLDTGPPVILLTTPAQDFTTRENLQTFTGSVNESVTLTLNGVPVPLDANNAFNIINQPLVEGLNSFTFLAVDTAGNQSTLTRLITLDTTPPIITVTNPQDGLVTQESQLLIIGNVSETVDLTINDQPVLLSATNSFSFGSITLVEGLNNFTLRALDVAGNAAIMVVSVTLDTTAPVITLLSPTNGLQTNNAEQIFIGSLSENATLTLAPTSGPTIPLTLDGNNGFSSSPIVLLPGTNTFTLTATDSAGNQAQQVVTVILDVVSPVVTITSPANNTLTNQSSITVTGNISEQASLTVNTQPISLAGNNTFSTQVILLEGINSFSFVAQDAAGNTSQTSLVVTRDSVVPSTPDIGLISRGSSVNGRVSVAGQPGSVEAGVTVRITNLTTSLSQNVLAASDGSFTTSINALSDDVFTLIAIDTAGNNSATATLNPPTATNLILNPIGDQVAVLGQTLRFTVTASAASGDSVSLGIRQVPLPANANFNIATGVFEFTPAPDQAGELTLTFNARTNTEAVSETITITVPAVNAAAPTQFSGRVLDATSLSEGVVIPIVGATITFLNTSVSTVTDAQGNFSLNNLPPEARIFSVDANTANLAPGGAPYASFNEVVTLLQNVNNIEERPFTLPRIAVSSLTQVIPTQTTVVRNPELGITVTVPPNTAFNIDGSQFVGQLSISEVPRGFAPAALPDFLDPALLLTLQPVGVIFSQPVRLTFQNIDELDANTELDIYSLNPDTGEFDIVGTGRVTADGRTVETISGGLPQSAWFPLTPGPTNVVTNANPVNNNCRVGIGSSVCLRDGRMSSMFELPKYRSLETSRKTRFIYQTNRANPSPVINFDSSFSILTSVPPLISYSLSVGGIEQGQEVFIDVSSIPSGAIPPPEPVTSNIAIDARDFAPGSYPYELEVTSNYAGTRITSVVNNRLVIANEIESSFGVGWMLEDLERLVLGEEGSAQLTMSDGNNVIYLPGTTPETFITPDGDFSTLITNQDGSFTHTTKHGIRTEFDSTGRQTAWIDRNNNTTNYLYDDAGRLLRVVDPVGLERVFVYGPDGLIETVTDPGDRTSTFEHDPQGNLTRITYPDDTFDLYSYNDRHLMETHTDERGFITQYEYNTAGQLFRVTLPDGTVRNASNLNQVGMIEITDRFGVGTRTNPAPLSRPSDSRSTIIDGRGNPNTYELDTFNRIVRKVDEVDRSYLIERDIDANPTQTTRPNESVITRTYDDRGNVRTRREEFNTATYTYEYDNPFSLKTLITNPRDHTTIITRDTRGNPIRIVNALGHTTIMDYDSRGRVERMVDQVGLVTTYDYFPVSGLLQTMTQTPPAGPGSIRVTQFDYDSVGLLRQLITPDNITLTLTYDPRSRPMTVTDNLGQSITRTYDEYGNVENIDVNDPSGLLVYTMSQAFDRRNRLISMTQPHDGQLESTTLYDLDENSNIIGMTDPNGASSTNEFDPANRLSRYTHRLNGITEYEYDTNDRITRVRAPNGVVTDYTYDVLGRKLTESSRDRGITRYDYDLADNLVQIIDGRGIITAMSYDELERMDTRLYANSVENVTYTYDNCAFGTGYVCARSDESGSESYNYDAFGNVVTVSHTELGVTYNSSYTYDEGDNIIAMTLPSGRQVTYGRDGIRRLQSINAQINGTPTTLVDNITYRADNKMLACTFGNGLQDTRSYDLQGRIRSQNLAQGTSSIDNRTYDYDQNSNLLNRTTTPQTSDYRYDPLDRVIDDNVDGASLGLNYDLNDNRLIRTRPDTLDSSYSYNLASNQLNSIDTILNNITEEILPTRSMTYNNVGRLSQITENSQLLAAYVHNARGQRTRKITASGTIIYHYDLAGNLVTETTGTGTLIRDYLWDNGMPAVQIDNLNAQDRVLFLHMDHLATPRFATNQQGTIVWRWEGQAFGETLAQEDVDGDAVLTTVNLRFPGQYFDSETGLHYNWNRYYSPEIGRYITSDPIGLSGGNNTYSYVEQNPNNNIDATGLFTLTLPTGWGFPTSCTATPAAARACAGYAAVALTGVAIPVAIHSIVCTINADGEDGENDEGSEKENASGDSPEADNPEDDKTGNGKSETHGDGGREQKRNEERIAEAERKLQELKDNQGSKKEKNKLRKLIKNLKQKGFDARNGEFHPPGSGSNNTRR